MATNINELGTITAKYTGAMDAATAAGIVVKVSGGAVYPMDASSASADILRLDHPSKVCTVANQATDCSCPTPEDAATFCYQCNDEGTGAAGVCQLTSVNAMNERTFVDNKFETTQFAFETEYEVTIPTTVANICGLSATAADTVFTFTTKAAE